MEKVNVIGEERGLRRKFDVDSYVKKIENQCRN